MNVLNEDYFYSSNTRDTMASVTRYTEVIISKYETDQSVAIPLKNEMTVIGQFHNIDVITLM